MIWRHVYTGLHCFIKEHNGVVRLQYANTPPLAIELASKTFKNEAIHIMYSEAWFHITGRTSICAIKAFRATLSTEHFEMITSLEILEVLPHTFNSREYLERHYQRERLLWKMIGLKRLEWHFKYSEYYGWSEDGSEIFECAALLHLHLSSSTTEQRCELACNLVVKITWFEDPDPPSSLHEAVLRRLGNGIENDAARDDGTQGQDGWRLILMYGLRVMGTYVVTPRPMW